MEKLSGVDVEMMSGSTIARRNFLVGLNAFCLGSFAPVAKVMAQEESPVLTFGAITDCHYADIPTAKNRYYRDSKAKLEECVHQMNLVGVDFLIELGDFKDLGSTEGATLGFLEEIEAVFSDFNGPRYHVLGNHAMDNISKEQFMSKVTNTGIQSTSTFYSFDLKGWHFVVLDANFLPDGTPYHKGNFDVHVTYISQPQLDWLAQDLAATSLPTIVFVHQLLDRDQGGIYVNNASLVRQILDGSGKVRAVFQGHYHAGGYSLVKKIHYVTLQAAIEGSIDTHNAFALVKVFRNKIIIEGFGDTQSRTLTLPRSVWVGEPISGRSSREKINTRTQMTGVAESCSTLDTRTFSVDRSSKATLNTKRVANTLLLLK